MRRRDFTMTLPAFPLLARLAATVCLLLLPTCVIGQKFGVSTEPKIPTFTVKGRAVFGDSDRPVRRAQITLIQTSLSHGVEKSGATDRDGRFVIDDVPTGV